MTGTVLVADDSPTIQNKAKGILTGEGLEVVTVSNGVAAIKKLPQVKPLLILADVAMPGRDGYEVCDFVKKSPDLRHIPVVLIFSDADPYSEEQGTRVRADGKIRKMAAGKPFIPEELISTVTGFLTLAESRAASRPAIVTEPVDEDPALYAKKGPDFSSLPKGVPFADPALEEFSAPTWSGPTPTPSIPEAETTLPAAPADERATEAAPPPVPPRSGPTGQAPEGHEPQLIEEPPAVASPPAPRTQRTILFRTPADIAEPLLHDELATPPPEPPSAPAEPQHDSAPAPRPGSFFPADRTTPEVRSVLFESEPAPESSAESTETVQEALITSDPDTAVDTNLVHSIVQKVVAKMSPPALSQEVIDEMARRLAGEIIAEIIAESS